MMKRDGAFSQNQWPCIEGISFIVSSSRPLVKSIVKTPIRIHLIETGLGPQPFVRRSVRMDHYLKCLAIL